MTEQYRCNECGHFVEIPDDAICEVCNVGIMQHLRYTRGGDGSHWEGCDETHWDCKIAKLEKELAQMEAFIRQCSGMFNYDPANRTPDEEPDIEIVKAALYRMCQEGRQAIGDIASRDEELRENGIENAKLCSEISGCDERISTLVETVRRLKEAGENLIQLANFKNKKALEYIDAWSAIVEELENHDYDNRDFHKGG